MQKVNTPQNTHRVRLAENMPGCKLTPDAKPLIIVIAAYKNFTTWSKPQFSCLTGPHFPVWVQEDSVTSEPSRNLNQSS